MKLLESGEDIRVFWWGQALIFPTSREIRVSESKGKCSEATTASGEMYQE
jgi:hypothetical protein